MLLSETGHENREYILNAGQTYSFHELTEALSWLSGKSVHYDSVSPEAFVDSRIAAGWPPAAARFVEGWFSAIHKGAFDEPGQILEALLERKPKGLDAILHDAFFN